MTTAAWTGHSDISAASSCFNSRITAAAAISDSQAQRAPIGSCIIDTIADRRHGSEPRHQFLDRFDLVGRSDSAPLLRCRLRRRSGPRGLLVSGQRHDVSTPASCRARIISADSGRSASARDTRPQHDPVSYNNHGPAREDRDSNGVDSRRLLPELLGYLCDPSQSGTPLIWPSRPAPGLPVHLQPA